ncbi:Spo0B C-terminal domain-containing protein [Bacillus massiliglaciei]|uniref:Spo0B C-terminal domain-containing protein n=1 Tax=Bacillus massiliglaciei TaxID=1816693 RepID=UPI000AE5A69C|nr:Spo0B C-terminal domain-containing protein [Bacillus massiliglaciei]
MEKKWTTVDVLRQSRHDWLNKIQIIKGNLELNKLDRVKGIIDEIIMEAQQEARLSNLEMPRFVELLLTANWQQSSFQCDYEVVDMIEGSKELDEMIASWTSGYFNILAEQLDCHIENVLTISIFKNEGNGRWDFHLQGKLKDKDQVIRFLKQSSREQRAIRQLECGPDELSFQMDINLETIKR